MTTTEHDDARDDQHWLDLMAGRDAPDADARTRKSAAWLRAAMLSYRLAPPPGAPAEPDARVHRLLARARDAGVLRDSANEAANDAVVPERTQPTSSSTSRRPRWPQALAASVLLCAAAALLVPRHGDDDATVLRGSPVQTLQAVDAPSITARRAEVLQALRAAGLDAQPFERLGRPFIDVALPVPLPPEQAAALKALGLVPPGGPSLQIEFTSPRPAP